jgi:hypothetical protein
MFLAQLLVLWLITVGRSVADGEFLRRILRKRGVL